MMRQPLGRGVSAMRARKRVADKNVAELGKLGCERRIVLLFAVVEAEIFEHGDIAIVERSDGRRGFLADAIGAERDGTAKKPLQRLCNGLQREIGLRATFRPAEVRDDDDLGAAVGERLEAGQDALDPRRVRDLTVLDRHVEISTDNHALSFDVNTVRRLQLVEIHSDDLYVAIVAGVTCSLTMRI